MRDRLRPLFFGSAALAGILAGGCSGNAPSLPGLPELTGTLSEAPIVGPPTEVYERIARGAMTCWFGAAGPLKANYVYHAEADPPGKGGKAEISIHERDRLADNPKGPRAYRIGIAPDDGGATTLVFENVKMPEPMARGMEADARRWGAGGFGCTDSASEGWSENTPAPLPPEGERKKRPAKAN